MRLKKKFDEVVAVLALLRRYGVVGHAPVDSMFKTLNHYLVCELLRDWKALPTTSACASGMRWPFLEEYFKNEIKTVIDKYKREWRKGLP